MTSEDSEKGDREKKAEEIDLEGLIGGDPKARKDLIEGEHGTTVQGDTDRIPRKDVRPSDEGGWTTYGGDLKQSRKIDIEEALKSPTIVEGVVEAEKIVEEKEESIQEEEAERVAERLVDEADKNNELPDLGKNQRKAIILLVGSVLTGLGTGDLFSGAAGGVSAATAYEIIHSAWNDMNEE